MVCWLKFPILSSNCTAKWIDQVLKRLTSCFIASALRLHSGLGHRVLFERTTWNISLCHVQEETYLTPVDSIYPPSIQSTSQSHSRLSENHIKFSDLKQVDSEALSAWKISRIYFMACQYVSLGADINCDSLLTLNSICIWLGQGQILQWSNYSMIHSAVFDLIIIKF